MIKMMQRDQERLKVLFGPFPLLEVCVSAVQTLAAVHMVLVLLHVHFWIICVRNQERNVVFVLKNT